MLNKIVLMGRLTKEPDMRTTQTGKTVTSFTLAVDRDFDRNNEVDFVPCVAWEKTAEFVSRYFHKGQLVSVLGSLQSRSWKDKNGNDRVSWEVICSNVYFAESRKEKPVEPQQYEELEDDGPLPF